ncbi:DUF2235 domain-containing protein [Sphingomonas sp. RT2P30]|uniref:phospholipase effector Tle1 domain-containing protein n=1 Tax=Parasphingomonas halimpatiens TaxID=3096162 RepID=UPI002FCBC5A8
MAEDVQPVTLEANEKGPIVPKRLVFCFDGTWNRLDALTPTNVVLTAESVLPIAHDGKSQAIFYNEGVGTRRLERLTGGVFGAGLVENLGNAYRFLTFNYTPGDEIFVFGFSRGAFTARSFVGLLRNCGIVARSHAGRINEAVKFYRDRTASSHPDSPESRHFRAGVSPNVTTEEGEDAWRAANLAGYKPGAAPLLKVRYVGVWDTVGALGVPARYRLLTFLDRQFHFHDTGLTSMVQSGRHAVAIDEHRADFVPTLWGGLDVLNAAAGSTSQASDAPYQQKWFPGVHCGVGGGGDLRGLSDQALSWVWDGAQRAGLGLDSSPGSRIYELLPDATSALSPFVLDRLSWFKRAKARVMDTLWRRVDRVGPTDLNDVSSSAARRWQLDANALPEKVEYRPAPLLKVKDALDAVPPLPPVPVLGTFDVIQVKAGESLSRISRRLYGSFARTDEIFAMNRDRLDEPDKVYVGMPLRVPKIPADT